MTTLDELVEVTLIHDASLGSAPETASLNGKVIAVPKEVIPLPRKGSLVGLPGFGRQTVIAGGALRWEWVLQGGTDPLDAFVDSLTGRGGWLLPASRTTVKDMCQALFNKGFTRTQIQNQMPQVYSAIAAEVTAEAATP